jgi:TonB family protein
MHSAVFALLLAATASTPSPGTVAHWVLTDDDPSPALQSPVALTRAAAARVAAVRDVKASLPALRAAFDGESDAVAQREELRALVLLGDENDVDRTLAAARKDPALMVAMVDAVARRDDALELFEHKLHPAGVPMSEWFLKQSLWQRPGRLALSGSRFIAQHDDAAWGQLLSVLRGARAIMIPGVVAASLNAPSEEMRARSVWYLVHTFAPDPSRLDLILRDTLAAPREEPSLREAFGRELLRRMLGAERKGDPRYVSWLQTNEADDVIRSEEALFQYFTDDEFFTRKNHCGQAAYECRMPAARDGKSVGTKAVTPPPYMLPGLLPPGLTDAILSETNCRDAWLAVGGATTDASGRVRTAEIVKPVTLSAGCEPAVKELMKLSLVTPVSLLSPPATQGLILARASRQTPCLDETNVYEEPVLATVSSARITPPKKVKQVEPVFPDSVRRSMASNAYALVIVQSVISRDGCVRSIQLLAQSPFPELNTATIQALVQWKFEPGRLDGKPVDVLFNLTVQYKLR